MWEKHWSVASYTSPDRGVNLPPSHVPWLESNLGPLAWWDTPNPWSHTNHGHDLDILKVYRPLILQNVPRFGFVSNFLMIGFRLCIFGGSHRSDMCYRMVVRIKCKSTGKNAWHPSTVHMLMSCALVSMLWGLPFPRPFPCQILRAPISIRVCSSDSPSPRCKQYQWGERHV